MKIEVNDIKEKLHEINWDFTSSSAMKGIHSIYSYITKLIPEIQKNPKDFLQIPECAVVLDHFCSSGTSIVGLEGGVLIW